MGECKKTKNEARAQERERLCLGDYVFLNFHVLAVATPILVNDLCSQV